MHIPDGFLSAPVAAAAWALGAASLAAALGHDRRESAAIPAGVLGSLSAFLFAAQMVNVPVAPGTSGHLVGATLAATLVGPWRALIVMAVALAIQSLLFQDGGLAAYGANLIDMGAAGCFVGFTVARLSGGLRRGPRRCVVGAALGAFAATLSGAALASVWLGLSGLYPLGGILPLMLVTHAAIGLLEAALTAAILVTLLRWRPDLVDGLDGGFGQARPAAIALGLLGLAILVAGFLAPFASSLPDGLERVARDLGFATRQRAFLPASIASILPGVRGAPLAAGLIGTCLVGLVGWTAARALAKEDHAPHR